MQTPLSLLMRVILVICLAPIAHEGFANRPDTKNGGALISEISEISKILEFISAGQTP